MVNRGRLSSPRNRFRGIERLERRALLDATVLDGSFGVGGRAVYDLGGMGDTATAVEVLADGRVLLAASAIVTGGQRVVLMRLGPDGTPDETFGDNGRVTLPAGRGGLNATVGDLHVLPDGKILAAASTEVMRPATIPPGMRIVRPDGTATPPTAAERAAATFPSDALAVARLNPDGSLDATFGSGGLAVADFGDGHDPGARLAVTADGRIVVVGSAGPEQRRVEGGHEPDLSDIAVARFNPDGSPDLSFNGTGRQRADFFAARGDDRPIGRDVGTAVAVADDGSVIVGGSISNWQERFYVGGFAILRYKPDGTPDESFGDGGRVYTEFEDPDPASRLGRPYTVRQGSDGTLIVQVETDGSGSPVRSGALHDLVVQDDGKVLAVGAVQPRYVGLARYNADGSLDAGFGNGGRVVSRGATIPFDRPTYANGVATLATTRTAQYRFGPATDGGGAVVTGVSTAMELYVGRFDGAGRLVDSLHTMIPDSPGFAEVDTFDVGPDGRVVAVGRGAAVTDNGEGDAWQQIHDALAVRIDPAAQVTSPEPPEPSAEPFVLGTFTPSPDPVPVPREDRPTTPPPGGSPPGESSMLIGVVGPSVVRRGKFHTIRLTFSTAAEAAATPTLKVTGPNGFEATAQQVKVQVKRQGRRASAAGGGSAVGVYRVAAPGGSFDAADNGDYTIRLDAATLPAGTTDTLVGSFQVQARRAAGKRSLGVALPTT